MNTAFVEVLNNGDKIAQAAGEPVKLPDDEGVAGTEFFQAIAQSRAVAGGSGGFS